MYAQLLRKHFQAAPPHEDYGEDGEIVLHGPVQLITHHGSEV